LPPPRDCNADTAGRNKRLPSFISHPNGILLRVFKKQRSRIEKDQRRPSFICHPNGMVLKVLNQKLHPQKSTSSSLTSSSSMVKMETATETERALSISQLSAISVTKSLAIKRPSFIGHPNGILLRVFKRQRSRIEKDQRRPSFICHPNGIVLKVLNQKLRRSTSSLSSAMEMETKMEKTKTKTDQNGAKQRVRQLNCAKQRANQHHYSHAHHRPPQQQYKSKSWTIAIILKLTFVAWDSWTYRIGF